MNVIDLEQKKAKKETKSAKKPQSRFSILEALEMTEVKIARQFMLLEKNKDNWIYNKTRKKWMYFDSIENIWVEDTENRLIKDITDYVEDFSTKSQYLINDLEDREWNQVEKAINKMQSAQGLRNLATCCSWIAETKVIREIDLDAHPYYINFRNGHYNLLTETFTGISTEGRDMLFTKRCNVFYDSEAKCPLWEKTINEIFKGDEEYIDYVQRVFGYALHGEDKEHSIFIVQGETRTGKSTVFDPIIKIQGDYYKAVPEDAFTTKGKDTNLVLAEAYGKRFLHIAETEKHTKLVLSLLKRISGNSPISGRRHHEQFFSYIAGYKIFMETNHDPEIGDDNAVWERIHNIKFERYFKPEERDLDLPEKLESELSGILNWLLNGWRKYQETRLTKPIKAIDDTREHREKNDYLQHFLNDCFILTADEDDFVTGQELFDVYCQWAEKNRLDKKERLDGIKFGQAIKKKKGIIFKSKRYVSEGKKVNRYVYVGMEFRKERG